jgi:hypothetical protein
MSESKLQAGCVTWFRLQYPSKIIAAIPNGGKRNIITAQLLKKEGVLAGFPDLIIPHPNLIHHGLLIEMKYSKNKPSPQQLQVIEQLRSNGYRVEVCYSFDSFCNVVEDYFRHT